MSRELLSARGLVTGFRRGRHAVIRTVSTLPDFECRRGEVLAVLGPNGVGKSTLLRTLAGLQQPLHGSLSLNGDDLHAMPPLLRAQRIAIVLSHHQPPETMRVAELIALGRHPHTSTFGVLTARDRAAVSDAIAQAGLQALAGRAVRELSDGEQQRAWLARALAQAPDLLILDEPTSHLDVARRLELLDLLHRVARDRGIAVVLSTHELDLALRHADRLLVLDNDGGGRIMSPGAADVAAQIAEVFGMRVIAMGGGEAATGDRAANEAGRI